jgi:hypothetical protein
MGHSLVKMFLEIIYSYTPQLLNWELNILWYINYRYYQPSEKYSSMSKIDKTYCNKE